MTSKTFVYRGAIVPSKIFEGYKDIQNNNEVLRFESITSTFSNKEIAIT